MGTVKYSSECVGHTHQQFSGNLQVSMVEHRLYGETNTMYWIKNLINRIKLEIRYRKKLKELRKRDPFIYK